MSQSAEFTPFTRSCINQYLARTYLKSDFLGRRNLVTYLTITWGSSTTNAGPVQKVVSLEVTARRKCSGRSLSTAATHNLNPSSAIDLARTRTNRTAWQRWIA